MWCRAYEDRLQFQPTSCFLSSSYLIHDRGDGKQEKRKRKLIPCMTGCCTKLNLQHILHLSCRALCFHLLTTSTAPATTTTKCESSILDNSSRHRYSQCPCWWWGRLVGGTECIPACIWNKFSAFDYYFNLFCVHC